MTKKVCKSTQGHSDSHGGYSDHALAKEVVATPLPTAGGKDMAKDEIQTYDFDGIEEVEFSEFHSPSPLLPDYAKQLEAVSKFGTFHSRKKL